MCSPVTHYVFPCHSLCISFQVLGGLNYWLDIVEQEMNETAVGKHNFHLREHAKVCREVDNYLKIFHVILEDMVDEVVYIIYIVIYFCALPKFRGICDFLSLTVVSILCWMLLI